jgi:2,4-dienoyl-CoA reductase-like NADH-dependent reductase (Old Yellow Enzyme family)
MDPAGREGQLMSSTSEYRTQDLETSMIPGLSSLFEPLTIKNITLDNRFVLPGMQRGCGIGGAPSAHTAATYRRYVEGGCPLIFTESTAVAHPSASRQKFCMHINEETKEAWRHCANEVKAAGGHLFVQLWHEGGHREERAPGQDWDGPTISPSGLVAPGRGHGKPATIEQLREVRDAFIASALIAKDVGASGVEVHGAHGYFLDQVLWSATNIRDDEYGGPELKNRMRLPLEIVSGIRAAVGPDYPISFRFSQFKEVDFEARICETPDDLRTFIEALRAAGVDIFSVSTRRFHEPAWPGSPLSLAGWVKSFTDAPVIAVGSVGIDREFMATLFNEGEAKIDIVSGLTELVRRFEGGEFDLIAIGRSQLGDPDWVSKVRDQRFSDIRHFKRSDVIGEVTWEAEFVEEAYQANAG